MTIGEVLRGGDILVSGRQGPPVNPGADSSAPDGAHENPHQVPASQKSAVLRVCGDCDYPNLLDDVVCDECGCLLVSS